MKVLSHGPNSKMYYTTLRSSSVLLYGVWNYFTSWRCPRKFNSFATVMHDLAVKFVQEVSTSAARFFADELLLILVSLSLSGVSLRLSGLLA